MSAWDDVPAGTYHKLGELVQLHGGDVGLELTWLSTARGEMLIFDEGEEQPTDRSPHHMNVEVTGVPGDHQKTVVKRTTHTPELKRLLAGAREYVDACREAHAPPMCGEYWARLDRDGWSVDDVHALVVDVLLFALEQPSLSRMVLEEEKK